MTGKTEEWEQMCEEKYTCGSTLTLNPVPAVRGLHSAGHDSLVERCSSTYCHLLVGVTLLRWQWSEERLRGAFGMSGLTWMINQLISTRVLLCSLWRLMGEGAGILAPNFRGYSEPQQLR